MLLSFHNIFFSLLPSAKLRRVGALYSGHARSVVSLTTDIVFSLYDMSAFRQVVKEIICHLIFWSHVISSAVATDLAHWFQASRAFVLNLDEIEVTRGGYGEANFYLFTHIHIVRANYLAFYVQSSPCCLDL